MRWATFPELLHAITIDAAMLEYLDGAASTADAPNESYARELMALFMIGRGNYSERDVRAAATALAGWTVKDPSGTVSFDPDSGNTRAVALFGRTVVNASDVVDAISEHPACARFVAAKLHRFFVGEDPVPERLRVLAHIFTTNSLEIRPLVEAIVRDPAFLGKTFNRPRFPVEWVTAAFAVCGLADPVAAYDTVAALGQLPFYPPNVAGWPPDGGTVATITLPTLAT